MKKWYNSEECLPDMKYARTYKLFILNVTLKMAMSQGQGSNAVTWNGYDQTEQQSIRAYERLQLDLPHGLSRCRLPLGHRSRSHVGEAKLRTSRLPGSGFQQTSLLRFAAVARPRGHRWVSSTKTM